MSLALVLLMIPVVVRSTEEMLRLVPRDLREASYALGVPRWKTIVRVVLPTAFSGIITGVLLGLARVTGETAPLLILGPYASAINTNLFSGNMAALPTMINQDRNQALEPALDRVWAAALTLIIVVMVLSLIGRLDRPVRLREEVRRRPTMAKRIDVSGLDVYYGDFKAVEDVSMTVEPRSVTALHRPVRLRQVDAAAHPQPDARGHPRRAGRGQGRCSTTRTSTADGVDPVAVRRTVGMVFQRPNPFPTMSIYDNVAAGLRLNGVKKRKAARRGGRALAARAPTCGTRSRTGWTSRAPACPAASSSGCASPGRSPSSRRCC